MAAKLFHKQRLLTPGPTSVPESVLLEMAQPIIHHRTKQFQAIFKDLSERLQRLYRTAGPVLSIAGSGTTAFEATQASLAIPGSKVLAVASGKFGERWQDIFDAYAKTLGVEVIKLNVAWGQAVTAADIEKALKDHPTLSVIALCHSETSTASACDIQSIAAVTRNSNALLLVDGITSVGAMPIEMDAWGIDALVWYKSWQKNDVPFTPPVSLIRGQRVALEMIEAEGLENVCARANKLASASRTAFTAMGLKLCSTSPSDSVTGAFYPEGVDDKKFRAAVRDNFGIHLAGGQSGRGAAWEGKVFRISHMGYVDAGDTLACFAAIEAELIKAGTKIAPGTGVSALAKALA